MQVKRDKEMQYKEICFKAMEVVKEAAAYVRERHEQRKDLHIEEKGKQNFVTEVDKKTEQILVDGLSNLLPESGFIAEEGTSVKKGDIYNWIIDPVDGTTNFIHGVFPFAISVGLTENEEIVAGIVYEFGLDEYFYAWKGGGAWLNGEAIHASTVATIGQSLIATGFPYTNFTYLTQFMNSMDYFMKNSHGLRRLGSAATDIAYVACGRYDGFYEYGLHPWDIAAGLLLVKEAGGEVGDFKGHKNPLFSENVICSNANNYSEFQETLEKIMLAE
ncbi:MAG: inositol monophosphatase [Bacteroidetes bacterium]|nr:MAG: inositol monophosphatase [Bacteroidota bacterium]